MISTLFFRDHLQVIDVIHRLGRLGSFNERCTSLLASSQTNAIEKEKQARKKALFMFRHHENFFIDERGFSLSSLLSNQRKSSQIHRERTRDTIIWREEKASIDEDDCLRLAVMTEKLITFFFLLFSFILYILCVSITGRRQIARESTCAYKKRKREKERNRKSSVLF